MPRGLFPSVKDSIVHDKPSRIVHFLPKHIHGLPENSKSRVDTFLQTNLPIVISQIVTSYIGGECDNRTYNIFFKEHFVKMSVVSIDLRWGHYHNGDPYRGVSLNGVVLKYWHASNRIPISSLTRVVSSHTFTTVNVNQRIDKQDSGGHRGSCMGYFSGMYCPYTGQKVRLPHITD
jgi:hypothetical protein